MYFRKKTSAGRTYLQIVESRRDGDQVRQQVIATLGRYEELEASGQLERLLRSGARFAAKAMVLSPVAATCSPASTWCSWTPPASTSKAPAAGRWAVTATARIIGPIFVR